VGDARHRPLEQLALADHLGGLGPDVPARVRADRRDTLGRGLPGPGDPVQPPQPASRDGERDHDQGQADDDAHSHSGLLVWLVPLGSVTLRHRWVFLAGCRFAGRLGTDLKQEVGLLLRVVPDSRATAV
jgi:hypothetical protein